MRLPGARLRTRQRKSSGENLLSARVLAGLTHELRTPMSPILGMSRLLLDGELTSDQRDGLETILKSGETLLDIHNNLLDATKLESGKLELQKVPFNVRDCIESVAGFLKGAFLNKTALSVTFDAKIPVNVTGDTWRLRQVLINLVEVARRVDYGKKILLNIETVECRNLGARFSMRSFTCIRFSIQNEGANIPAELLQSLLYLEFPKKEWRTSGMGRTAYFGTSDKFRFALNKRLVGLMGGKLRVEGGNSIGMKIYFDLPFEKTDREPKRPSKPEPQRFNLDFAGSHPLKILLVNRHAFFKQPLENLGYKPDLLENGLEALGQWHRQPYDAVVFNAYLEKMDVLDVVRRLREIHTALYPSQKQPYIIVGCNPKDVDHDREKCLAAGADDYFEDFFIKPVNLQPVLERAWSSLSSS